MIFIFIWEFANFYLFIFFFLDWTKDTEGRLDKQTDRPRWDKNQKHNGNCKKKKKKKKKMVRFEDNIFVSFQISKYTRAR